MNKLRRERDANDPFHPHRRRGCHRPRPAGRPAQAFDINAMSEAEREAFGAQVREYILANPELILEAVDLLEQRQQQAEAARDDVLVEENLAELQNDGYSWVGGNLDGDITLVEFMDYRCGYCRRAVPEGGRIAGGKRRQYPPGGEGIPDSWAPIRWPRRHALPSPPNMVAGDAAYKQVHDALLEFSGEVERRGAPAAGRRVWGWIPARSWRKMDSDAVTAEVIANNRDAGPEVLADQRHPHLRAGGPNCCAAICRRIRWRSWWRRSASSRADRLS